MTAEKYAEDGDTCVIRNIQSGISVGSWNPSTRPRGPNGTTSQNSSNTTKNPSTSVVCGELREIQGEQLAILSVRRAEHR